MSALSLQYPKKPIRVSDDLESFVYVIVYMTLRHFRHAMSPEVDPNMDEQALADVNGKNNDLATRVHFLFCASYACEGGYRGGGEFKLDRILRADVPVPFPEEAQWTPLALLLNRLYELLNIHYYGLDYDYLKQYAAPRLKKALPKTAVADKAAPAQAPRRVLKHPKRNIGSDDHYGGVRFKDPKPAQNNGNAVQLSDKQWVVQTPLPKTPNPDSLVLNSHISLVRAFEACFWDEDGNERDLSGTADDKYVDQFIGLQAMLGRPPRKPTTKRPWSEVEEGVAAPDFLKEMPATLDFEHKIQFSGRKRARNLGTINEDKDGEA